MAKGPTKGTLIYEGKAKKLYEGPEPGTIIQHFKDDATAFNNQKKGTISGKGVLNNRISEFFMLRLAEMGIPTHFIRSLNMREQLVKAVEIIPIEVVIRNRAAGSFASRFKIAEGELLPYPLVEYYLKSDELNDPMLSEEHIFTLDLADQDEMEEVHALALRINDYLSGLLRGVGLTLVDFKIEFGRLYSEEGIHILLADEISPDSCRLWDVVTNQKLDKDRFRHDMGGVSEAYQEVARRLGVLQEAEMLTTVGKTKEPKPKK
jgi:phosphoribosylaminoimidazole-succinocarboxamide synthase